MGINKPLTLKIIELYKAGYSNRDIALSVRIPECVVDAVIRMQK